MYHQLTTFKIILIHQLMSEIAKTDNVFVKSKYTPAAVCFLGEHYEVNTI